MAAILGGMTLLQVAELAGTLIGAAKDIQEIHDNLKSSGHPPDVPIPVASRELVQNALKASQILAAQKSWDDDHSN